MPTFSSITEQHLDGLTAEQAVEVFRGLLWAEARAIGVPISSINITKSIYIADGGVDAKVDAGVLHGGEDLIKGGLTVFQIKTGEFSPWNESEAKNELFGRGKDATKANLKLGIAGGLDANGIYSTILFGSSPTPEQKTKAVKNYSDLLKSVGYTDPKIEVLGQSDLLGYLEKFPSLKLKLNGRLNGGLRIYENWVNETEMRREFVPGPKQQDFITKIQDQVRITDQSVHLRVLGEAGIGKTRLVFESIQAEDLKSLTIYAESPDVLELSGFVNEITLPDSVLSAVIVVDECDQEKAHNLWNQLKNCGSRIKLITIFNEFGPVARDEALMEVPGLDEEAITKIIENYGVPNDQARRWARFCENSPRVAHVIGQNLVENPDDPLRSPGTVDVWGRFIAGRGDSDDQIEKRKHVLQFISLFKRFGFGKHVINEAKAIHNLIQSSYTDITWPIFTEIVESLKSRKILQGQNTLYITPKALHIWLWLGWWKIHGTGLDVKEFAKKLPPTLQEWFYDMFRYASGSDEAMAMVKEILSEDGPFNDDEFFNDKLGTRFFLALTETDPKSALNRLEKFMSKLEKEDLLKFQHRRDVLWALERIAVWRELFPRAARLMLRLAEAENDTVYSNNATGMFQDLFTLGPNHMAPTEAPPEERFPVIEEALNSKNKEQIIIAIKTLDKALEIHLSRVIGAENQGLRRKASLWSPKTWGEVHDAYRYAWKLLSAAIEFLEGDEQKLAIDTLLNNARSLGRLSVFSTLVVETLNELSTKPYVNKNEIVKRVIHVLHYGKELSPEEIQQWEDLKSKLIDPSFRSQLNRYVAMDLLEDQFEDREDGKNKVEEKIKTLAEDVIKSPELLDSELSWLVTAEARNGYNFGYNLGLLDTEFKFFEDILNAYEGAKGKTTLYFFGGYMRAMKEKDEKLFEAEIDKIAQKQRLLNELPELIWRAGASDHTARLILKLAQDGKIDTKGFGIFTYGAAVRDFSEIVFQSWITFLLSTKKRLDATNALSLFHYYYDKKAVGRDFPKDLALQLLTADVLFKEDRSGFRNDVMEEFHWAELSKHFIQKYPNETLPIAEKIIQNAGNSGSVVDYLERDLKEVLNQITHLHPKEVLGLILESLDSKGYYSLRGWLGGGDVWDSFGSTNEVTSILPLEDLWKWVDQDIEKRAWYLASIVPKDLFNDPSRKCLAREVIIRYGDREDVSHNLMGNFSTEGWSGSASEHYQRKKEWLLKFKETENNDRVKKWVDEYVEVLENQIEQAKVEEERDDWRH